MMRLRGFFNAGLGPAVDIILCGLVILLAVALIFAIIVGVMLYLALRFGQPQNLLGAPPIVGIALGEGQAGGAAAIAVEP